MGYDPKKYISDQEADRFRENIRRAQATDKGSSGGSASGTDSCMVALGAIALAATLLALVAGTLGTLIYWT